MIGPEGLPRFSGKSDDFYVPIMGFGTNAMLSQCKTYQNHIPEPSSNKDYHEHGVGLVDGYNKLVSYRLLTNAYNGTTSFRTLVMKRRQEQ